MAGAGGFGGATNSNDTASSVSGRNISDREDTNQEDSTSESSSDLGSNKSNSDKDDSSGQTSEEKGAAEGKPKAGSSLKGASSAAATDMAKGAMKEAMPDEEPGQADQEDDKSPSPGLQSAKKVGKQALAASAVPAAKLAGIVAMLQLLKLMFSQAVAAIANIWSMIVGAIVNAAKAVAGFFVGIGQGIASAVGGVISATAAGIGAATSVTAALVIGGSAMVATVTNDAARHDGLYDCDVDVQQAMASIDLDEGDISEKQLATAKQIYGVMSALGLSDEHIAGMLGNGIAESGIDPTKIETIYGESYVHGSLGQQAEKDDFLRTKVAPDYPYGNVKKLGIGIWQWTDTTDGTATSNTVLRQFAEKIGKPWYELQTQLAFMISPLDEHNADFIKYKDHDFSDPVEAATRFREWWERNPNLGMATSENAAAEWYPRLAGFQSNQTLANSILELADVTLDEAGKSKVASELNKCITSTVKADNSSMAKAMVSFSWVSRDLGVGNNGTKLYVWLHDEIWGPNPTHYADCGYAVSTAVRWSGSDDDYVHSPVAGQLPYVAGSDKWVQVKEWNGDISVLEPGDIFYAVNVPGVFDHTVMYVGEETVVEIKGDKAILGSSDIAHASHNVFSPIITGAYPDLAKFVVYRLIKPDNSDIYRFEPPASAKPDEGCSSCPFLQG